jgi:hypothetical protein
MRTLPNHAKSILCSTVFTTLAFTGFAQLDTASNLPNMLLSKFTNAVIKFKTGQSKSATVNYNTLDEVLLFEQGDRYMSLDDPHLVDTLFMANRRFVPVNNVFYELVMTGPVTLFIQHKSTAEPLGTPSGYGVRSQTTSARYQRQLYGPTGTVSLRVPDDMKVENASEYWVRKGGDMEKFSNKRQFLKIFKDKEKELNKFIDANSISFKNLSHIVKLFNYCNELYA